MTGISIFAWYDIPAAAGALALLALQGWLMVSYSRYDTRRWEWIGSLDRTWDRAVRASTDPYWNAYRKEEAEHAEELFHRAHNVSVLELGGNTWHSVRVKDVV